MIAENDLKKKIAENQFEKCLAILWNKWHCCYYKCASFVFGAWAENPIMRELRDRVLEFMTEG